jgi:hypothetical protein
MLDLIQLVKVIAMDILERCNDTVKEVGMV